MHTGNGNGPFPSEVLSQELQELTPEPRAPRWRWPWRRRPRNFSKRRSLAIAIVLFAVTVVSTPALGAQFPLAYATSQVPAFDDFFSSYFTILRNPHALAAGLPFAATLLGILLAHELGHFFTCRYYGIAPTYPYFIPAPTLIGTLGAFILIRSPIVNRKALFDVGLSGPVAGFICIVPAMALAVLDSKILPGVEAGFAVVVWGPLVVG